MTEPRATYDAGTFPTQPVGSTRREIEILVSGTIDLFTEYRDCHYAVDLYPDQNRDEWARAKVMQEVTDSLEAPSPTLAAMLAADALVEASRALALCLDEVRDNYRLWSPTLDARLAELRAALALAEVTVG